MRAAFLLIGSLSESSDVATSTRRRDDLLRNEDGRETKAGV